MTVRTTPEEIETLPPIARARLIQELIDERDLLKAERDGLIVGISRMHGTIAKYRLKLRQLGGGSQ